MDVGALISNNKAFLQKVLTGLLTTGLMWVNKKYALGLDPAALAGLGASIIVGIAIHAAAKDHGVTVAASDAAADEKKPG